MRQADRTRGRPTSRTTVRGPTSTTDDSSVEDVFIRNYDPHWGYDLDLQVRTPEGDLAFESRYYLPPGHTASEVDRLPTGAYEVAVVLDNSRRTSVQCTVDGTPEGTILVELGNGAVSVTEGLYG